MNRYTVCSKLLCKQGWNMPLLLASLNDSVITCWSSADMQRPLTIKPRFQDGWLSNSPWHCLQAQSSPNLRTCKSLSPEVFEPSCCWCGVQGSLLSSICHTYVSDVNVIYKYFILKRNPQPIWYLTKNAPHDISNQWNYRLCDLSATIDKRQEHTHEPCEKCTQCYMYFNQ